VLIGSPLASVAMASPLASVAIGLPFASVEIGLPLASVDIGSPFASVEIGFPFASVATELLVESVTVGAPKSLVRAAAEYVGVLDIVAAILVTALGLDVF
jgi:hypothetical protein